MHRILILEDEPRIASFMEKGLNKSGFATAVVDDGNLALDTVTTEVFDLMLLDLGVPGKDGEDVLKELRQQGRNLPVIIVTARSIDPVHNRETYGLADEVVSKPFRMKDLITKVKSILQVG